LKPSPAPGSENSQPLTADIERFLSVLACFPGIVFATDRPGVITLLHGRSFAAAGIGSTDGLVGQSIFEVFKNHPALVYSLGRALEGQPCNTTVGLGNLVMEFWCGPYCDARGEIAGMVGTASDITERLKTAEAFRQTKEMLEAVINSSPLGLAVLDVEGNVRLWNPAAERKYGWSREEIMGRRLPILPTEHGDYDLRTLQTIFTEGSITDEEHRTVRRDGSIVPVSLSGAALHNSSGEVTGAMFVAMDLTERKRAHETLKEARFRAEAANRAKSEFLTNMSHEIRTPMNAVIGMLQLVLDTPLTTEQEHYLRVAKSGAESLMGLLNDILDFSRIEARTLALANEDFDIRSLLGDTAEALALQAHAKGLELTCQVAPSIPDRLHGDPLRLRQVLTNLLANALKFTPEGEVGIVVGVASETDQSATLRFQVTDTGIGVAPEHAAAMFAPFVQGDGSSTRKFGGAGLGLAISRQLVGMMDGQMGVESELGRGSTFWFTAVFAKPALQPGGERPPVPPLSSVKALVVDDSGANRTLVGALLKSWGARCHQACDGPSALTALSRAAAAGDPFRLVLVDMSLPEMDGLEVGRQIAANPELRGALPVLMTFPGQQFDPDGIRRAGFASHVWKPVLASRLASAVADALSLSELGGVSDVEVRPPVLRRPGHKRILVVEDDSSSREVALAMAEKLGYDADPVNNGAEALVALQHVVYDGVLMDCEMPEMDGLETTARVRGWKAGAHNAAIPIIALTAHARATDRERCLRAGMNDYLSKPIDSPELARVLSRWLGSPGEKSPLPDTGPIFDWDSLLERFGGRQELADQMIHQFVEETPQRLKQLKHRIDDRDGSGTRTHAQVLRSAAAAVSALSLCALASAVEEAGVRCEFGRAAGLLPHLEDHFRQFARAVQAR
jgi:two-component system sensor histidine kinase/response regulator